MIGCFMNYSGSKSRHSHIIEKVLPKDPNLKVLEGFCGGFSSVHSYPESWKITANDKETNLIGLHQAFQTELFSGISPEDLVEFIKTYCHSWMNKNNKSSKEQYEKLKADYNKNPTPLGLYTLVCSSFSNQIRFNGSGEFNLPKGDRYFNPSMEKKLLAYLENINKRDITFNSMDFRDYDFSKFDLVICDPPYLKTTASYNENGGWQFKDSVALISRLTNYATSGGKFVFFEELWSNGTPNTLIQEWATDYNIVQLGDNSDKCNYQRKGGRTQEVMVTNL